MLWLCNLPVSIHAPWEGCDTNLNIYMRLRATFQFTHPGKGATTEVFIIDLPRGVSIHAPWEGCDSQIVRVVIAPIVFQFTHPGKGATSLRECIRAYTLRFQFTHPGKGATTHATDTRKTSRTFQFTHPGKGATATDSSLTSPLLVSIHAPWEGCDL